MSRTSFGIALLAGASVIALASPTSAQQTAGQADASQEIVVTGSRVQTNGFKAPTPVTTLSAQALQEAAPSNIPDALNELPQFKGSQSQTQGNTFNPNSPNQGNYLNLRNLGTQRALVLLDGVRVPPTSFAGGVDVNTLPQMLVQKVDVVTGGASAAYGSDAVAGVINFVLDKNFNGVKAEAQAGTSIHGDADSTKFGFAAGDSFLGGRLHLEGSAEYYKEDGLSLNDRKNWDQFIIFAGGGTAANPFHAVSDARYKMSTFGGLILSGPASLVGKEFQPNGTLTTANLGQTTTSTNVDIGGDGAFFGTPNGPQPSLIGDLRTTQAFLRGSYEVTSHILAHAQIAFGESRNTYDSTADNRVTGANALTIFSGNAFLNPTVQAALGAAPSFTVGRQNSELPLFQQNVLNDSINANFGVEGDIRNWKWDLSYVEGYSSLRSHGLETNNPKFYAAVDAVKDSSGNTVCRVTITNPGLYPGCVPLNLFGVGAPSQAAINYVMGNDQYQVVNQMHMGEFNVHGDLFRLPAGPVVVAAGVEFRRQTLDETSNANPAIPINLTGLRGVSTAMTLFRSTNVGAANGAVNVGEGYLEGLFPLLKDMPFVKSMDLDLAYRYTNYSTSGGAQTWKAGLSWEIDNDFRFRSTVSRDIAAPNLYELYQGRSVSTFTGLDPHTGVTGQWLEIDQGTPNLKPEVGSQIVVGFVYSPHYIPHFTMSLDHYGILIDDAIGTTTGQQELIDCEASNGTAPVCGLINRPGAYSNRTAANFPTTIMVQPQNLSKIYQAGEDFEASYELPLHVVRESLPGSLNFRLLISHLDSYEIKQGPTTATMQTAGSGLGAVSGDQGGQNPKWSGSVSAGYHYGPWDILLTERATGSSDLSHTQFYSTNARNPNVWYTDLYLAHTWGPGGRTETFLDIHNLFNVQPPIIPGMTNIGVYPANKEIYDVIGTYFTVGIRQRW